MTQLSLPFRPAGVAPELSDELFERLAAEALARRQRPCVGCRRVFDPNDGRQVRPGEFACPRCAPMLLSKASSPQWLARLELEAVRGEEARR